MPPFAEVLWKLFGVVVVPYVASGVELVVFKEPVAPSVPAALPEAEAESVEPLLAASVASGEEIVVSVEADVLGAAEAVEEDWF